MLKVQVTQPNSDFEIGDVLTADDDFIVHSGFVVVDGHTPQTRRAHLLGRAALTALLNQRSTVVPSRWRHFVSDRQREDFIAYLRSESL